jgi:hypothetical protein
MKDDILLRAKKTKTKISLALTVDQQQARGELLEEHDTFSAKATGEQNEHSAWLDRLT